MMKIINSASFRNANFEIETKAFKPFPVWIVLCKPFSVPFSVRTVPCKPFSVSFSIPIIPCKPFSLPFTIPIVPYKPFGVPLVQSLSTLLGLYFVSDQYDLERPSFTSPYVKEHLLPTTSIFDEMFRRYTRIIHKIQIFMLLLRVLYLNNQNSSDTNISCLSKYRFMIWAVSCFRFPALKEYICPHWHLFCSSQSFC
jgi:hypothetical protein